MNSNPQLDLAFEFLASTGENIFLTGRAGTGKTTFLRTLREHSPKRMIVVAPTGVAAINAGGVTMHSFFQLPLGAYVPGHRRAGDEIRRFSKMKIAIIKSIDLLVIDEISMVRADMLDSVDDVLRRFRDRRKPFGGVQLLMIGDMGQLSPVVKDHERELLREHYPSPYFFDSQALRNTSYTSIELQHIYRQRDEHFIDLLARVRENRVDDELLAVLNQRHIPDFDPPQSEGYITLTSHNHTARAINEDKLAALATLEYSYNAEIERDFPEHLYPAEVTLRLKKGAQVMFTKNDSSPEKRFVNGTIGEVVEIDDTRIEVKPSAGGESIVVERAEWNNTKYSIDPATNHIVEHIDGVFRQYPLRTAWAITIHKSQGLTFDRAIIDAAESFSHGQVYVALSRCRTLEGMVLRAPMRREAIIKDLTVDDFSRHVERNQPDKEALTRFQRDYYRALLCELFDFDRLLFLWNPPGIYMEETLARLYPKMIVQWKRESAALRAEVVEVGEKFRLQITRLTTQDDPESNDALAGRVTKGAKYFLQQCETPSRLLAEASAMSIDNKEVKKRLSDMLDKLNKELRVKLATLTLAANEPFTVQSYLEAKGGAISAVELSAKIKPARPAKADIDTDDIHDPELFELLRQWRHKTASEQHIPVYVVANQKALIAISNSQPSDPAQLLKIRGIGKSFIEKYAGQVLAIIAEYNKTSGAE
ncbi:MAG: AAA family ATPase [Alistipes sp.]|jgi:energy-coupling factor transporter ATP-binding protein EcfA2|nr:AAA family ATPase [Alistipes sp.]